MAFYKMPEALGAAQTG